MPTIETDTSDWDHWPNGEIETLPLAAWATAAEPGVVLLRLEILIETGQIGTAQVRLPAQEATALAESLAWMAGRAESDHSQGTA